MSDYRHDIEKYLKGELTSAERNALERKALHDPFLADALEGAEQIKAEDFSADVTSLQSKIGNKKTVSVWMWSARIAASLILIAISSFIVWMVIQPEETTQELAFENKTTPSFKTDSITAGPVTKPAAPVEEPSASDPAARKELATRSEKAIVRKQTTGEEQLKNEPLVNAIAADVEEFRAVEPKTDEAVIAESVAALDKQEAEIAKEKVQDDVTDQRLAQRADKKKAAAAKSAEGAPSATYNYQPAAEAPVATNFVSGRVTSSEDGSPLPGVNVVIKGTARGTVTDAKGNYQIEVEKDKSLVYSFIGLSSQEIPINDTQEVDVQMALDVAQLSEVVVTAYGVESSRDRDGVIPPSTFELAHPENGTRAFKQYLERNIRYPQQAITNKVEGRVTVQFTVESDGGLSNFVVLKGIGSGCDEEVIRLIKEGPQWIPTKREGAPLKDEAKVRVKFELPK
jgi:TonB family protein